MNKFNIVLLSIVFVINLYAEITPDTLLWNIPPTNTIGTIVSSAGGGGSGGGINTRTTITPVITDTTNYTYSLIANTVNEIDLSTVDNTNNVFMIPPQIEAGKVTTLNVSVKLTNTRPNIHNISNTVLVSDSQVYTYKQNSINIYSLGAISDDLYSAKLNRVVPIESNTSLWANMDLSKAVFVTNVVINSSWVPNCINKTIYGTYLINPNSGAYTYEYGFPEGYDCELEHMYSIRRSESAGTSGFGWIDFGCNGYLIIKESGNTSTIVFNFLTDKYDISKIQNSQGSISITSFFPSEVGSFSTIKFNLSNTRIYFKSNSNNIIGWKELDINYPNPLYSNTLISNYQSIDITQIYTGSFSSLSCQSFAFAQDGKSIIIISSPALAMKYDLSEPWKLETAIYHSEKLLSDDSNCIFTAVMVNDIGTKMIVYDTSAAGTTSTSRSFVQFDIAQ